MRRREAQVSLLATFACAFQSAATPSSIAVTKSGSARQAENWEGKGDLLARSLMRRAQRDRKSQSTALSSALVEEGTLAHNRESSNSSFGAVLEHIESLIQEYHTLRAEDEAESAEMYEDYKDWRRRHPNHHHRDPDEEIDDQIETEKALEEIDAHAGIDVLALNAQQSSFLMSGQNASYVNLSQNGTANHSMKAALPGGVTDLSDLSVQLAETHADLFVGQNLLTEATTTVCYAMNQTACVAQEAGGSCKWHYYYARENGAACLAKGCHNFPSSSLCAAESMCDWMNATGKCMAKQCSDLTSMNLCKSSIMCQWSTTQTKCAPRPCGAIPPKDLCNTNQNCKKDAIALTCNARACNGNNQSSCNLAEGCNWNNGLCNTCHELNSTYCNSVASCEWLSASSKCAMKCSYFTTKAGCNHKFVKACGWSEISNSCVEVCKNKWNNCNSYKVEQCNQGNLQSSLQSNCPLRCRSCPTVCSLYANSTCSDKDSCTWNSTTSKCNVKCSNFKVGRDCKAKDHCMWCNSACSAKGVCTTSTSNTSSSASATTTTTTAAVGSASNTSSNASSNASTTTSTTTTAANASDTAAITEEQSHKADPPTRLKAFHHSYMPSHWSHKGGAHIQEKGKKRTHSSAHHHHLHGRNEEAENLVGRLFDDGVFGDLPFDKAKQVVQRLEKEEAKANGSNHATS